MPSTTSACIAFSRPPGGPPVPGRGCSSPPAPGARTHGPYGAATSPASRIRKRGSTRRMKSGRASARLAAGGWRAWRHSPSPGRPASLASCSSPARSTTPPSPFTVPPSWTGPWRSSGATSGRRTPTRRTSHGKTRIFSSRWRELPDGTLQPLAGYPMGDAPAHLRLLSLPPPLPVQTVLEEAQFLIHGPRQGDYGHPFDDFSRTGRIWGAILGIPDVPPEKVALCMVGVKLSRQVNKPKRDNLTDGCGYLGTIELIETRRGASHVHSK